MKGIKLSLFLFIIWWSNDINSSLELQTTPHKGLTIKEKLRNFFMADVNKNHMASNNVDHSQEVFNTQDLKKICDAQVNKFVWKCPTSEEKFLTFRTINDTIGYTTLAWYLKSINGIDIVNMDPRTDKPQIQFYVTIDEQRIYLSRVYPTYPEVSGFEIIQFIANLAFQCKFFIDVVDASDISTFYSALYGKSYYEYHFKGIDLTENFLFKNIVVEKKTFLDCFKTKIESHHVHVGINNSLFENLPHLFHQNIQACENAFLPVEFCPLTFSTHHIFYKKSFQYCIDWSPIGGIPGIIMTLSHFFEITSKDITRIMNKKKQSNMNFIKINQSLDNKIIKTYDKIKSQISDTSFLLKLFFNIFELCFFELEKIKSDPNPEDIFKLYLRPCVIPNINLFLKYYTDV